MIFDAKISSKKAPSKGSNALRTKLKLNETCLRASGAFK